MKPVVIVDPGALVVAGTCANRRGEVPLGRKSRCSGTYFGNDLLRRIHSQTGPVIDLASAALNASPFGLRRASLRQGQRPTKDKPKQLEKGDTSK
jgi:hypothetical protein